MMPPLFLQKGGGPSATPHTSPPLKRRFLKKIGGIAQFDSLENRSKVTRDPPYFTAPTAGLDNVK